MIQTVLGPVKPENVGMTSMHEHLFIDGWTSYYSNIGHVDQSAWEPMTLANYGAVRRNPGALRENLILKDAELTSKELQRFKDAGGSLVVNATPRGAVEDGEKLLAVAKNTGTYVVATTGLYLGETLSSEYFTMSAAEMAKLFIQDIQRGIGESGIKAGVIGELGAIGEMDTFEKNLLEAGALTQRETGAAITLHTACPSTLYDSPLGLSWKDRTNCVLDFLEKHGADLSRVIVGHPDVSELNPYEDQLAILERGIVLEYDNFGQEHPYDRENTYAFTDWQRIMNLKKFVDAGYGNSLVLASDLWQKAQYASFGGWGFDHIITNILPMMRKNGFTERLIEQIMIHTPRRLLDLPE